VGETLDFGTIKRALTQHWEKLSRHDLFRTGVSGETLWATYLASFPPGTDPKFRERTHHDCSCCRVFIRDIGGVVAIIDGKIVSLWDFAVSEYAYQAVADAMSKLVKAHPIVDVYLHRAPNVGTDRSHEKLGERVHTWNHFHLAFPRRNTGRPLYCNGPDIATKLSDYRASHDVLLRSLTELTVSAGETILELIAQNSLYRGAEQKHAIDAFLKLKREFDTLPANARDTYAWSKFGEVPEAVARIRNTAIGTLLIDLSADLDLEEAVRKFESVLAPQNYKRPTALVTKKMVEDAKAKIAELGLASALERRYATLTDISVNNIIFANRSARKVMKGDVFDDIATKDNSTKNLSRVESIPIANFVADVVPHVTSMEVMLENKHHVNLVSLIAPVDSGASRLFKWDNNFSWTYNNDVTDSIKERVKRAGGSVTGELCCRLAWFNYDDLDFHMYEAGGGRIWYMNRGPSPGDGRLDVDMNAGRGVTREPVENIFYHTRRRMREGTYQLVVHQYHKRESIDVGFEVEMDYLGEVTRFAYEKAVRQDDRILVAKFNYTHAGGVKITESLPASNVSRNMWGLKTQDWQAVNVLMHSPNYWDEQEGRGNKHYFFMLDGCVNDGQARGFFNEFLRADLDKHRKVIEIVGSKMKTEESASQLSGLGFSETKRNELLVRVKGNVSRTLKVVV
jgi:hypothetical protein